MPAELHFKIEYKLQTRHTLKPKHFLLRAAQMNQALAWYWAAVDAGFAQIPKRGFWGVKVMTPEAAYEMGIREVSWSQI